MTRIAVVGAGAVGGVVAWHLARAGLDPLIVARPSSAEVVGRDGLTMLAASGPETVVVRTTSDAAGAGPHDLVIVGFKGQDWPSGLSLVQPLIGPKTVVVPLLNGIPWWFFQGLGGPHEGRAVEAVDPGGVLARAIPAGCVVGCVVYVGASREGPSRIVWNGRQRFVLGEPSGGASERLTALLDIGRRAGLAFEGTADIRSALWHKLFGNATYNPLSALTGATMGRLADHPPLRAVLRTIMEEVGAVGRAIGIAGSFDIEERLTLTPLMRPFKTSMLQDMEAGRPLELAGIVDAVVELARLTGVPVPVLETVGALTAERWMQAYGAP